MNKEYLEILIVNGNSTYSIAKITKKSQTAIVYWLKKYDLKTVKKKSYGNCIVCGIETVRGRKFCNTCNVKLQRLRYKIALVNYKGGKCIKCGFDKNHVCLDFHHKDKENKEFNISEGVKSWNKLKQEADKCDLLCSNCHRIEHHKNDFWKGLETHAKKYKGQNQDIIKYL